MVRKRRLLTALVALAAAWAALPADRAPAQTATAQVLTVGQVQQLTDPGVALRTFGDPRLNTYGAASVVAGVAFTEQAGVGTEAVTAAAGAQIVVFHLVIRLPSEDLGADPATTLEASVVADGTTVKLDVQFGPDGTNDTYWAVAVPTGAPTSLVLSCAGLTQTFDLRAGHRVGPQPVALYRDASQPEVTVAPISKSTLTAALADHRQAELSYGLSEVTLSYWLPGATDTAAAPDQAFLTLYFDPAYASVPADQTNVTPATLPGSAVHVVLPDGTTLPTTHTFDHTYDQDLLSGDYYAVVPADISSVKVRVTPPPSISASLSNPGGFGDGGTTTMTLAPPPELTVDFPPPAAFGPLPAQGRTPAATTPAAASSAGRSHGGSSGGGAVTGAVIAALALVMAGVAAVLLRRRRQDLVVAARALRWPPPGLTPAAAAVLASTGRRALPAAATPLDDADARDLTGDPTGTDGPAPDGTAARPSPEAASMFAPLGSGPDPVGAATAGTDRPALVIRLLGPPEIEGLRRPIRRRSVLRLLVCLAVSTDRSLSADELAMAISDHPEREPKPQSVHSYASILRQALPPGVLPDAGPAGYRLDPAAVVVDWVAVTAAEALPPGAPDRDERARAALELVRGQPLAATSWEGIEPAVRVMQVTVERLARAVAAGRLGAGDPSGAEWAAARGLAAAPGSVGLWQDRLEAAGAGSGYGLERAWADARSALGADAGLLAARYQQLRGDLDARPPAPA